MKVLVMLSRTFPYGSPQALRTRSFIKMIRQWPAEVVVLCDEVQDNVHDYTTEVEFDGYQIFGVPGKCYGLKRISGVITYLRILKELLRCEKPDLVFYLAGYDRFSFVEKIVHKHRVPILLSSCEWYDPSTFRYGNWDKGYLLFQYNWKYGYPKADGVVAISRLLEQFYLDLGLPTIRIPTIIDMDTAPYSFEPPSDCGSLRLLFAGSFARTKDSIRPFFEALSHMGDQGKNIVFDICGADEGQVCEHLGEELFVRYKTQMKIRGRVPQSMINSIYMENDFGIFIRPDQRSSNAGFSTKIGEGMSVGTPFIINDTSDISLYIENGKNGFIVENESAQIAQVLLYALEMSCDERKKMREEARKAAYMYFNTDTYMEDFKRFSMQIIKEYVSGRAI